MLIFNRELFLVFGSRFHHFFQSKNEYQSYMYARKMYYFLWKKNPAIYDVITLFERLNLLLFDFYVEEYTEVFFLPLLLQI